MISATVSPFSTSRVATILEQHTEVHSSGGVTALVRMPERLLRLREPALLSKPYTDLERPICGLAVISATVSCLGTTRVAALLEEHTEIQSCGPVAALLRTPVGLLRLGQPPHIAEQLSQIERPIRVAPMISATVSPFSTSVSPRSSSSTPRSAAA